MSVKYNIVERKNPQNPAAKKWYASAVARGTTSKKEIAKTVAQKSSLTVGDIDNVIANLIEEIPKELLAGNTVRLGEFGSFRISLSSKGAQSPWAFDASLIEGAKIVFTPGVALRQALSEIQYEKNTTP